MRVRGASQRNRKVMTLSDFGGADYYTSPLDTDIRRATYISNFINKDGRICKRSGWRQLMLTEKLDEINGIFEYVYADVKHTLIHSGKKIYRLENDNSLKELYTLKAYKKVRSRAFFHDGFMYLITGIEYLVYGRWDGEYRMRNVGDIAYVPTTTINIDRYVNESQDSVRETLDEVNLLTRKRKNKLVGCSLEEGDNHHTWYLDAPADINESITVEYTIFSGGTEQIKVLKPKLSADGVPEMEDGFISLYNEDGQKCGACSNFRLTLTVDTTPPIENESNVTVTFTAGNSEDFSSLVGNCTIGVQYGLNGGADRLFLAGNAERQNIDICSYDNDYTYFPINNFVVVGSSYSPIKAYEKLADGTLAIYKADSNFDAGVYYRTCVYNERYDEMGNLAEASTVFPTVSGAIGEGAVSSYATANLAGDTLFLSKTGVKGLIMAENVSTNIRYARERSRLIDSVLCKQGTLSEAVGIVFGNRYYLAIDGNCYVADARRKCHVDGDIDGSFQYEWWCWNNVPARVFAVVDGALCFGTDDGRICVFDGEFTDRKYDWFACGEGDILLFEDGENRHIKSSDCVLHPNTRVFLKKGETSVECFVKEVTDNTFTLDVGYDTGNVDNGYEGIFIERRENVVSQWQSRVIDMGTNLYSKTLLSVSVTAEPGECADFKFSYQTADSVGGLSYLGNRNFSFSNLSFDNLAFNGGFASSATKKLNVRNFNYIIFGLLSEGEGNCSINSISAVYKINKENRGTR